MRTSLKPAFTKYFGSQQRFCRAASAVVESLETRRLLAAFVVNTLLDQNDALSSSTVSLRDAITRSNADGEANTITFAPSLTASGPATITLSNLGALSIDNTAGQTTITGPGAGLLSISGNNASRVFDVGTSATVAISGLTITQGSVPDVAFPDGYGGGIFNDGTLTLTGATVTENSAGAGAGGILNNGDGELTVLNSTISSNNGGAQGGGILSVNGGTITITGSTFSGNTAPFGGAIYSASMLTITNSTFSGNSATALGGGIDIYVGTVNIFDSTISANTVGSGSGGGINNVNGTLNLNNTIVAGNTGTTSPDINSHVAGAGNLIGDGTGMTGLANLDANGNQVGSGGSPLDPMLGPLAYNDGPTQTMTPLTGSPAINSGSNAAIPVGLTTDQRGGPFSRTNAAVDVGAVEFNPTVTQRVVNTLADSSDATGSSVVSLRDAITTASNDLANPDFNVYFAPSLTAAGPVTITLSHTLGVLYVGSDSVTTTINGPGANLLSISGNNAITVFDVTGPGMTVAMSGLTITDANNGNVNYGGGIENNGTLTLTSCDLTDNTANRGGAGIYNGGTLNIIDCTFTANHATTSYGGAIVNFGTMLTVSGSTFSDNTANNYGGAIYNSGPMMLTNSTFSGNSANYGGALVNAQSATIANCTFNGNTATTTGGAIYLGDLTMANCTISGNSSPDVGGIYEFTGSLNETIIAGNTGFTPDISGTIGSGGYDLIGDGSDVSGITNGVNGNQVGTDAVPINPKLGALADNGGLVDTMALLPGSPALDAGNSNFTSPPTTDARGTGFTRVADGRIDIGAYEAQQLHFVVSAQSPATIGDPVYFTVVALDEFGQPAGGYNGTVHFETGDGSATLPSDTTLNSDGDDSYVAVFGAGGPQDIEAFDTVNGSIDGVSGTIQVIANPMINTTPSATSVTLGSSAVTLKDTAVLSAGYNETGTITFTLYQGSTLLDTEMATVSGDGTYSTPTGYTLPTSGGVTGTYQWDASYSGDSNNTGVSENDDPAEQVVVYPATVSIVTSQQPAMAMIGDLIADKATLSGAYNPTGTVTFYLYNNPFSNGPALFTGIAALSNGVATSESDIETRTGTYYWVAIYNGDSNNATITSGAASEPVVIGMPTPSISTTQQPASATVGSSIADKATVSGGDNPTGTVTFKLYNNSSGTGTPLLTDIETLSGGVATSLGISATAAGTDYWVATYSGNSNNSSVASGLAAAPVSITSASPAITTTPSATSQTTDGPALNDTAVLSGGYNATGTITFTLYLGSTLVDTEMATVNGNGSYTTPTGYTVPTTGSVTGTYQWDASYGGDSNNSTVSENNSAAEQVVVSAGNHAPTDIALSANSVAENQPSGTAVGTLNTTDPDTGNTFTYTLVSGTGSTDNASFEISGDTLETAAVLNNPAQTSYSVRIRSTDQGGLFTEKTFTISVPAPAVARLAFVQPPTNVLAGQPISPAITLHMLNADGTINSTDKSKVTLSIVSGPTNGKLVGAKPTAAKSGLVTFGKISLTIAGVYVLHATDGTYAAATSTITVAPAAASKLVFSNVPAALSTGQAFSVQVNLFDKYGNLETSNNGSTTLALGKHTKGTTLSGTLTGNLISGTEIFSGLSFSSAGVYSLIASSSHLAGKSTGTIKVTS